jgi:CheY-like chemotaxis protein
VAPAAATEDPVFEAHELPSLDGLALVVADDEAESLDIVSAVLRERGARVTPAASSEDALEAVRQTSPDLLVANIEMAGDLMARLRAVPADQGGMTPAVALSAQATAAERIRALLAGYQGHVGKPVRPAELVALVATLTDRMRTPALTS